MTSVKPKYLFIHSIESYWVSTTCASLGVGERVVNKPNKTSALLELTIQSKSPNRAPNR